MIATNFEFNGIQAKDIDLYICNINNDFYNGTFTAGSNVTFKTSKATNNYRNVFHGSTYEEVYTTNFQVIKMKNCNIEAISAEEKAYYLRLLQRKDGYKYLRFFEEGYENIYYNAKLSLEWIEFNGLTYGANISVECDAPFGYSKLQTYDVTVTKGNTFDLYDDSDELGFVIPELTEIKINSNGNLVIKNQLEDFYSTNHYQTEIRNCVAGETMIINGVNKQITSSSHPTIANDYNYNPIRILNLDDNIIHTTTTTTISNLRKNIFTVTGCNCTIHMAYRTIKKAVI